MNRKVILKRIINLKNLKDVELIKMELYGIVVGMILSKEEFPNNAEIAFFFKQLKIEYKPYLLKSRTALLGRAVRNIEKADENQIRFYLEIIEERAKLENEEKAKDKEKRQKKSNYMSTIMQKYGRTK